MDLSRRRALLGLGVSVGAGLGLAGCREGGGPTRTSSAPPPRPSASTRPETTRRAFPGQPPSGSLYYGASVPHGRSLRDWELELGATLALHRSYFTPDANETTQLVAQCRADLSRDRMPHVSIKPPGTWEDVASGRRDDWLVGMLEALGESGRPLFLTLHHEPENDAGGRGMLASHFVSMQQRAIRLAAELGPSVVVTPVLQHWTFDPAHPRSDPSVWLVPEAPVVGLDVYNPWSPTNGKEWRTFGSKLDEVLGWFDGKPLVIGEHGCREDPANPGLAAQWLRDAADYARSHGIVSMSYFNSGVGADDGSWELSEGMQRSFAELLAAEWVARPG